MIRTEEEHLAHYGIKRRSGRYPWGSGGEENKRNKTFLDDVAKLKSQGMTEAQIAEGMGLKSTTELRAKRSIAVAQQRQEKILTAQRLKDRGWSNVAIGQRMGLNESSVRALLAPGAKDKADALQTISNMLKDQVAKKKYIDVGVGVEKQLGITNTKLKNAVAVLKEQGYVVHNLQIEQLGTGKLTKMQVLTKPGTTFGELSRNRGQIKQIDAKSQDYGRSFVNVKPPLVVNSKRVGVNYLEDGGGKADGVIYIRPDVKDLSLGSNRYGQVRIALDNGHYLKGMAVYKDDLPEGKDIVFNTKKTKKEGWKSDSNKLSDDPDLPFGTIITQLRDHSGNVKSALNMVGSKEGAGAEGYWDTWARNLPSQMLSKQRPSLAERQLNLAHERYEREFKEISSLTNPTVRKELLLRFGDQVDYSAVHLEAANMPRQATKVLLPIPSMKEHEVYAPSMRDGETVALVRFPHGGTFEIPQLRVNNRNREARKIMGSAAKDAIGINHKVAQRLSGADFDGDTVLVIPHKGDIRSTRALKELKDFDPMVYRLPKDSPIPRMTSQRKGDEMGNVSNLITDMTIMGAKTDEISRAIRHSMVVIDAEKHELDWKQSEKDFNIPELKQKYQGGRRRGAATILSRATAKVWVPERKDRPAREGGRIDIRTGKKMTVPTGKMIPERATRINPVTGRKERVETGKLIPKTIRSRRLAEAEDAFKILPKGRPISEITEMERIYALHSNRLKAMANEARKEAVRTKATPYSPSAKKVYAKEVSSLNAKLNIALKNAPYERQAQLLAGVQVSQKRRANPHMEPEDIKKIKTQALADARVRTGAKRTKVIITKDEWDAIQAGAISKDKLEKIIINGDLDNIRELAMPKHVPLMTSSMKSRATQMLALGYTQAEVADQLGVGLTTLKVGLSD